MPNSDDRFYLMEMRNRPVKYGDIGSLVRLEGVVIGGGEAHAVLLLPGINLSLTKIMNLEIEEWSDWLQRSDNPEILVGPTTNGQGATLPKIWHRKLRYEISGAVQQKVWAADGFACVYCGVMMGKALLTIDHFQPLETGGRNDVTNYVTSCKACNKDKGSQDPETWMALKKRQHTFETLQKYLTARTIL